MIKVVKAIKVDKAAYEEGIAPEMIKFLGKDSQ